MARTERTFTPRPDVAETYESRYQRYVTFIRHCPSHPKLRELFRDTGTVVNKK